MIETLEQFERTEEAVAKGSDFFELHTAPILQRQPLLFWLLSYDFVVLFKFSLDMKEA